MLHKCGFCQGRGEVRRSFKLHFGTCQVCSGRGTVYVEEPIITCAFCEGTGIQPNAYPYALLTCPACRGKGVATLKEPSVLCPDCLGRGGVIDGRVYCLTCEGKGRVEVKGDKAFSVGMDLKDQAERVAKNPAFDIVKFKPGV